MGRLNLRMEDGLIVRVKAVCGEGGMSNWFRVLAEKELGGRPVDRVLARLDALEDEVARLSADPFADKQPAVPSDVHVELDENG